MGSQEDDNTTTVYGGEDLEEEEDDDDDDSEDEDLTLQNQHVDLVDDEEDDEEEDDSMSSAAGEVPIAVAGVLNASPATISVTPTTAKTAPTATTSLTRSDAVVEEKKPMPLDDSRRLFQRLWNDEDEIELLQGFLDYNTQRGMNNSSHHHDTAAFYDQIKCKLQLEFNKNQLVEKLRRLKKKYRNVISKINSTGKDYVFKSPHDQATFDLSRKIWSSEAIGVDDEEQTNPNPNSTLNDHNGNGVIDLNSSEKKAARPRKRSRPSVVKIEEKFDHQCGQSVGAVGAPNSSSSIPNMIEETMKRCFLPLFKELINGSRGLGGYTGMNLNLLPLTFGGSMDFPIGDMTDAKWRRQQILELEVYSARLELMQDQIKSQLEELKSMRVDKKSTF